MPDRIILLEIVGCSFLHSLTATSKYFWNCFRHSQREATKSQIQYWHNEITWPELDAKTGNCTQKDWKTISAFSLLCSPFHTLWTDLQHAIEQQISLESILFSLENCCQATDSN